MAARRALNYNSAAAAASLLSVYLHRHIDGAARDNDRAETQCDAAQTMPFQRLKRPQHHDVRQVGMNKYDLRAVDKQLSSTRLTKTKQIKELHAAYKVDWNTVLGEGAYGRVYPARDLTTGEQVALKKISKLYTNSSSFRSETDALLRIYDNGGHPNISGLRDMYSDGQYYYLILDLVPGGEMFEHLIEFGSYSEDDASRLVQEILSALAFLHNIGIIHADLKPENILMCEKKQGTSETVKIIDFGCAKVDKERGEYLNNDEVPSNAGDSSSRIMAKATTIGTKAYWAPECFEMNTPITESIDLWAVGVIVYIMLVGSHPFDTLGIASDQEIEQCIQTNPVPPMTQQLTSHLSPAAKDFIKSLMNPDPEQRLTALSALRHSWIRGEKTSTEKISELYYKLTMYQDLKHKLATGIFAALVDGGIKTEMNNDAASRTHILKRAFEVFDEQKKGYVNESDLNRVITKVTGKTLTDQDQKNMMSIAKKKSTRNHTGLSLSDFSQSFSRLRHEHFPRGSFVYKAGDLGDCMYFINSGKVEIRTEKGHLVAILRHGDFFGEGSLLEDRNYRSTSVIAATPVEVLKVPRQDFDSYISNSRQTKDVLKSKYKARKLHQAKQLIRLQTNLTKQSIKRDDIVYREGDMGDSMYLVDDDRGGKLEVKRHGSTVHVLQSGDTFGESSLLFRHPRKSTIICASNECNIHELLASAFHDMLESDPSSKAALHQEASQRAWE